MDLPDWREDDDSALSALGCWFCSLALSALENWVWVKNESFCTAYITRLSSWDPALAFR